MTEPTRLKPHHERRDGRNVARLGIISIQSRVDDTMTTWTAEFSIDRRPYRVECAAPYGRPHGVDTDIILAIQTLFVRAGCPTHNWLHTTGYELRHISGLPDNGRTYHRLKDSLKRLWGTGFVVAEGWHDEHSQKRVWSTDTLRYIDRIRYHETDSVEDLPGLDPVATISIRLGEQLADSIRARQVQVLDGQLLVKLEQPPARALYRLLEAHRVGSDGQRQMTLTVQLEDWRLACGIQTERPELVRRALHPAHEELRAVNYLTGVTIEGRGKAQVLHYAFAEDDAPDPALVELLIGVGVSRPTARTLAAEHGDRVETAVAFVRHKQQTSTVKRPAGLAVDYLRHEEKYVLPEDLHTSPTPPQPKDTAREAEAQAAREAQAEQDRIRALPPSEQFDTVKPALKLLLKSLSKEHFARLEDRCREGTWSALDLRERAAAAMADVALQTFVDDLRKQLA